MTVLAALTVAGAKVMRHVRWFAAGGLVGAVIVAGVAGCSDDELPTSDIGGEPAPAMVDTTPIVEGVGDSAAWGGVVLFTGWWAQHDDGVRGT